MESLARKWWGKIPEISVCAESAPVMWHLIPRLAAVLTGQDRRTTGHSPAQLYNATTVGGSCRQRSVGEHAVGNACDACDCSGGGSACRTFDIQDP